MPAIVVAEVAHAVLLAEIHAASIMPPWSTETFGALLGQPGVVGWTVECADVPAGFLLARAAADEAEILTLAVIPPYRRCGVARHLMQTLFDWVTAHDIARLHLEVAENNEAARALYEHCGFASVGRRTDYYGRGKDALMLAWCAVGSDG